MSRHPADKTRIYPEWVVKWGMFWCVVVLACLAANELGWLPDPPAMECRR